MRPGADAGASHGRDDAAMERNEIERHAEVLLGGLRREFAGKVEPGEIEAVGGAHLRRLTRKATILDYVPILVYRATREDLRWADANEFHRVA